MMNGSRQEEETLFEAARKLTNPVLRKVFLDAACAENPDLRHRLEVLLSATPDADKFFEESGAALNASAEALEPRTETEQGSTVRVTLPPEEQPGARIGHYKLREKIGEGGCGVVYVAEQEEPIRRRVALKIIKPGMDTRQVIARFEAERQALAMMDHPNIAKVLDAGTTEHGHPYFVMELVRGIRITDYCDQNQLDTDQRLELFIQVCHAVQHAHQKGIIHRDLKPSNILVTLHDGIPVPKVIDFGVAKATEGRLTDLTVYTQLHQFIGTPAYMSPEQAEMSGLDIDTRSDIYSLGVLLYELLTGATPFDAGELLKRGLDEVRRTIREVEPPRPSTRLSTLANGKLTDVARQRHTEALKLISLLRGDLDWVVMKCLEKDRTRRYETANGLAMELKRFLQNEPVVARPPSAAYRLEKLVRRNKLTFAAGAIVFFALIVGLGVSTWSLYREHAARREADLRRQEAEKARADEKQQRLRAEAEELTARRFAYASDMNLVQQAFAANNLGRAREVLQRNRPQPGQADLRGWEWRYLWQRCRGDSLFTLCQQPNGVLTVAFADSGNLVALRQGGEVQLWDPASRRQIVRLPASGYGRALTVSPDSTLLAYGSTNANGQPVIELWSVVTRTAVAQLSAGGYAISLAFAPDRKSLAAFGNDRKIRLWNLETHQIITNFAASSESGSYKGAVVFSPDGKWLATGETDGRIRFFDLTNQSEKIRFVAHAEGITALAFSPDGALLASGSGYADGSVKLWQVPTGEPLGALVGHNAWIPGLAFAPDGQTLASASSDQTIRLWDIAKREQLATLRGHLNEAHAVAFSPDGKRLVSGSKDGDVIFWDTSARRSDRTYALLPLRVRQVGPIPGSQTLVSVNQNGTAAFWDPLTVTEQGGIVALGTNNLRVAVSSDGTLLAAGDRARRLKVRSLVTGTELTNFIAHSGGVYPVKFLADDKVLLTGDSSGKIKRWEVATWREISSWEMDDGVSAVGVSSDERFLAAAHGNGTVTVWDAKTGQELAAFAAHPASIPSVAFTPDARLFITGGEDGAAKLWDTATWKELAALRGTLLGVHAVAVSRDGQRLITGSNAREAVKIWDLATRQEVLNLEGQGSQFSQAIFSHDGSTLVAVNIDGWAHVWHVPSLAEIEATEKANAKSN
jgi:WD40 repeat protein/serine/threonine protein kinase